MAPIDLTGVHRTPGVAKVCRPRSGTLRIAEGKKAPEDNSAAMVERAMAGPERCLGLTDNSGKGDTRKGKVGHIIALSGDRCKSHIGTSEVKIGLQRRSLSARRTGVSRLLVSYPDGPAGGVQVYTPRESGRKVSLRALSH